MDYEAILFDMDGVLVTGYHTDPALYEAASRRVLPTFDVDPSTAEGALISPPSIEAFRAACESVGIPPDEVWAARERATDELENEQIAVGDRTLFDDIDALDGLEARLGIVSNNRQGTVDFVVDHFDLPMETAHGRSPTFDGYGRMKPDPHYLNRAMADLEISPADVLYVGDRGTDVETAQAAGCDGALLERDGPIDEGPTPTRRIDTLHDLA